MVTRGPSEGSSQQLSTVAKLISEAQTLDTNGDELGAYRHYLLCVSTMTQTLSQDIQANQGQGTLSQQQCAQLFQMARSCLDRGEKIYSTAKLEQRPLALFRLASPSPTNSPTSLLPLDHPTPWPRPPPPPSSLVNHDTSQENSNNGPRTIRQLSYVEQAKLRNQAMMEQYKVVLRESATASNVSSDVRLSMLRRLDENLGVAKIREQSLARKLRERELRLQQSRPHSSAPLISLTVDELCDLVTSYEHGKTVITNIKVRLNTAGSNFDQTYSAVTELLSLNDHPLTKLLAEGQHHVYTILQPLVCAVEQAGGLPRLEIRLDNCSLDRKPSEDLDEVSGDASHAARPSTLMQEPGDDDDLLYLLTDEDEDLLTALGTSPTTDHTHSKSIEDVLEPMVRAVERQDSDGFNLTSNAAYVTVNPRKREEEPRYVTHEELGNGLSCKPASVNKEQSGEFHSVPLLTEKVTPPNKPKSPLYEQLDELKGKVQLYERLDAIETTDGGLISRPPDPTVVFDNLPPLVCAAHYGDENSLVKLSETASSIVKEATKAVRKLLGTLEEVFSKCYPVLSSEDNREVVGSLLEANFFPAILPSLTLVYRCHNYHEECTTATNMCQHVNATPKDLAVREKYWLIKQTYAPYGEAIDELRQVPSLTGPTPKLDGLVRVSKKIIECIDEYHRCHSNTPVQSAVGVDDILPILSYVIIRSGLPELVTECSIMEEFIREEYTRGEEGFCLTSFITALKFVTRMSS